MENEAPGGRRAEMPEGNRRIGLSDSRRKADRMLHLFIDCGRGLIIFLAGIFFLIAPRLGVNFGIDDFYRYSFSGLCLLYGGWRVYRGYKKNYY